MAGRVSGVLEVIGDLAEEAREGLPVSGGKLRDRRHDGLACG
jgi:hypothetical protein